MKKKSGSHQASEHGTLYTEGQSYDPSRGKE